MSAASASFWVMPCRSMRPAIGMSPARNFLRVLASILSAFCRLSSGSGARGRLGVASWGVTSISAGSDAAGSTLQLRPFSGRMPAATASHNPRSVCVWSGEELFCFGLSAGNARDGFNFVSIRIEDKSGKIIRCIMGAQPRGAVITSAMCQGGCMKSPDHICILSGKA